MTRSLDEYLWLEDVEGERALSWAEQRSAETLSDLESDPAFTTLHDQALAILEAQDKIAWGGIRGELVYNFWQDAEHVRGLWRCADHDDYVAGIADNTVTWQTLLDVDALAEAEQENWVWHGATLNAERTRAILSLSRGGKDAAELREYDLTARQFVDELPFVVPEAKSSAVWADDDTLLIGTDFGPDTLTSSGYPRQVRLWRRGDELSQAAVLHTIDHDQMGLWPGKQTRREGDYLFLSAHPDFFTQTILLLRPSAGELPDVQALDLPADFDFQGFFDDRALGILRSPWRDRTTGTLVAVDLQTGTEQVIWTPDERSSLAGVAISAECVVLVVLRDVISRLLLATPTPTWSVQEVELAGLGSVGLISVPDESTEAFLTYNDFLTPPSLVSLDTTTGTTRLLAQQPARFDAAGLVAEQHFATSADGTRVPYFHIGPADAPTDGSGKVILYGYGGFEISLTPGYRSIAGRLWWEQGNHYVIANLRGGGEYGPSWHQAALKTKRDRSFEDFEAVAEDLIARGVTSPEHLGIEGGSNGGLLVGSAFTRRPELYGAVFCAVPLLDMMRFHLLLAGASWTGEYGDPDGDPEVAQFWLQRSPLHRVQAGVDYPELFFYTSTRDDRVHPGHARKMVARMSDLGHDVLYYENTEGGHAASANLPQLARQEASKYVFFGRTLSDGC